MAQIDPKRSSKLRWLRWTGRVRKVYRNLVLYLRDYSLTGIRGYSLIGLAAVWRR